MTRRPDHGAAEPRRRRRAPDEAPDADAQRPACRCSSAGPRQSAGPTRDGWVALLGVVVGFVLLLQPVSGAAFSGTGASAGSSTAAAQLAGTHAPASGSTVTMNDALAGTCTTTWGALSGGTAVASTFELRDLTSGGVLSSPGNVSAGSYGAFTPTATVTRHELRTRKASTWVSSTSESAQVACTLPDVRSVDVGLSHSCGIRTAGTLFCWGLNAEGQLGLGTYVNTSTPTQVGASTWRNVTAGSGFSCGVPTGNTLWCWGANGAGQLGLGTSTTQPSPTQVGSATSWRHVSAGAEFACATRTTGTLWCWGANWGGQLGQGNTTYLATPTQVGTATDWKQIAVGDWHACGVRTTGTLWCWGYNGSNQLGDGTTTDRWSPTQIGSATDWRAVAVGAYHACAIRTSGALWCWGANWNAQLGDGTYSNAASPVPIATSSRWADVAIGRAHTCATAATGTAWCWGWDAFDPVGDGSDTSDKTTPTQVGTGTTWGAVAAGFGVSCAVREDATLWCWGHDGVGQLGRGTTTFASPALVDGNSWSQVASGGDHVCAVRTAGTLYCWGLNTSGQTGIGHFWEVVPSWYGLSAGSATDWSSVATGTSHSCGIRAAGTLWCWGEGGDGQLGDGTATARADPTQVGTSTWSRVAGGEKHTCAIRTTGTLWCWGEGGDGQLGLASTSDHDTPQQVGTSTWSWVSAGDRHTCGVRTDGTGWCWGRNGSGEVGDGSTTQRNSPVGLGGNDWSRVVAGDSHSCGVRTSGTLWCWGDNSANQLGDGTTTQRLTPTQISSSITDWTDVSALYLGGCARRTTSNRVHCWGGNRQGETGQGTTSASVSTPTLVSGVSANSGDLGIAMAHSQTPCAIQSDTALYCWGGGRYGQLGYKLQATTPAQSAGGAVWRV